MTATAGFVAWRAARLLTRWALARAFQIPHVAGGPTPADLGLTAEDVTIDGPNGKRLRAWFLPAGTERGPAVLVVHGWTGNAALMLPVAKPLLDAGLHVLLLDTRCHGRSDDDEFSSMPAFAEDARRAVEWLRSEPRVDPARIALLGHSVGAGACLLVADRDPSIAAVVSLSSMADPARFMGDAMRRRHVPGPLVAFLLAEIQHAVHQRFTDFAPTATIARLRMPVLLVHGDADPVVPLADAEALHAAAPPGTELIALPGADHAAVERFLAVAPRVTAFLRRAVGITP